MWKLQSRGLFDFDPFYHFLSVGNNCRTPCISACVVSWWRYAQAPSLSVRNLIIRSTVSFGGSRSFPSVFGKKVGVLTGRCTHRQQSTKLCSLRFMSEWHIQKLIKSTEKHFCRDEWFEILDNPLTAKITKYIIQDFSIQVSLLYHFMRVGTISAGHPIQLERNYNYSNFNYIPFIIILI